MQRAEVGRGQQRHRFGNASHVCSFHVEVTDFQAINEQSGGQHPLSAVAGILLSTCAVSVPSTWCGAVEADVFRRPVRDSK
jgi:hypothetical protein